MRKSLIIFTSIIIALILFSGCKSEEDQEQNDTSQVNLKDTSEIDITADTTFVIDTVSNSGDDEILQTKYICPLGDPEGNNDEPGICPVCEMELIENPDYIIKTSK